MENKSSMIIKILRIAAIAMPISFLIASPQSAQAAPYAFGGLGGRTAFYIDLGTINRSGDRVSTWTHGVHLEPLEIDGKFIDSTDILIEFDCQKQMMRYLSFTAHHKGQMIYNDHSPESEFDILQPNGPLYDTMRKACSVSAGEKEEESIEFKSSLAEFTKKIFTRIEEMYIENPELFKE